MKAALRWLLIVGAWIALSLLVEFLHKRAPQGALTQAEYSLTAPGATQAWQPVTLPHDWRADKTLRDAGTLWYRLRFEHDVQERDPGAVLLWYLSMNAAVWLNGERVGDGGAMDAPVARNWFRPLLFSVPAPLLRGGANELLIEVRGVPAGDGFLGPVYVDDMSKLLPAYESRYFLKVTFLQLTCVLFLTMALPTGILWFKRRQDTIYLWHAAAAVLSAIYIFVIVYKNLPGAQAAPFWEWLRVCAIGWMIVAIIMLIHRYLGIQRPKLERIVWIIELGGAALMLAYGLLFDATGMQRLVNAVWEPAVVALGGYPAVLMFKAYATQPDRPGFWLMLTGNLLLILGIHDLLMVNHLWPPYDGFYVNYGAPGPLIAFTGILLERFLHALRESETLNRELAARVEQKSDELRRSYDERKTLEDAHLLAEERGRILMDMHDGIGGRLVSTLARLEKSGQTASPVGESVREALADLRLIIYSLEPSAQNLRTALALMRERLQGACEDAGIAVRWSLDGLPDEFSLGPRSTLQLLRLVQEAITNVLKHAQATRLDLGAAYDVGTRKLRVEIADNGCGLPDPLPAGSGKGIENLRRRARHLDGTLSLISNQPGLKIILELAA